MTRTARAEIKNRAKDIFLWVTVGFFVVLYLAVIFRVYG